MLVLCCPIVLINLKGSNYGEKNYSRNWVNCFNTRQKNLVIEEMKDKPILEKKAGMLSFPMETMEKKETPEATLERLLLK